MDMEEHTNELVRGRMQALGHEGRTKLSSETDWGRANFETDGGVVRYALYNIRGPSRSDSFSLVRSSVLLLSCNTKCCGRRIRTVSRLAGVSLSLRANGCTLRHRSNTPPAASVRPNTTHTHSTHLVSACSVSFRRVAALSTLLLVFYRRSPVPAAAPAAAIFDEKECVRGPIFAVAMLPGSTPLFLRGFHPPRRPPFPPSGPSLFPP
jgi:hypothetical protein